MVEILCIRLCFVLLMVTGSLAQDMPDFDIESLIGNKEKTSYFYSAPNIDVADKGSWTMPPKFRCEACIGVGYQFQKHFRLEEEKRSKKGADLVESQILDVTDRLCSKGFKKYGAKTLDGRTRLSGEGLKAFYEYGMTGIGPGWVQRMQGICQEVVGLLDEVTIYDMYKTRGDRQLSETMCETFCTAAEMKEYRQDVKTMDLASTDNKFDDEL
ncbi:marginal zone B- and B1-cell-specific protein-like [Physella acuta]|uniref:marginal zone B- and B1-cell-specific protein-like n=1 Tax=Physella acuta TaxID=109671 RepID=UPI0027DD430E|nr:marginal zone B- and B1-cell-specific protein-like [Physella acuta]